MASKSEGLNLRPHEAGAQAARQLLTAAVIGFALALTLVFFGRPVAESLRGAGTPAPQYRLDLEGRSPAPQDEPAVAAPAHSQPAAPPVAEAGEPAGDKAQLRHPDKKVATFDAPARRDDKAERATAALPADPEAGRVN